jgi:glutamine synthetase
VPGFEAPCYVAWSASNRSALVRIPASRGKGTRVELRCPDPSCNPYLALALCLTAGLDGIEKKMTPPAEITENIYDMTKRERKERGIENLPASLEEAIKLMKADPMVREVLGEHTFHQYVSGKKAEWDLYRTRVSQWEIEKYLVMY